MVNPVLIIALAALVFIIYSLLPKNQKKLKRLRQEWENGTYFSASEDFESVSSYWKNKKEHADDYAGVDSLTWNDLSMQDVFEKLNYTQTSVGSEYLFNQLRDIDPRCKDVHDKEELYALLERDQKLREKVLLVLSGLGKRNYTNTSSYFYEMNAHKIKHAYLYIILAVIPILSIVFMLFSLKYGVAILTISFITNLVVYYRNKKMLEIDLHSITYVAAIVNTGKNLATIRHTRFNIVADILKGEGKALGKTAFWGKVLSISSNKSGDFDVLLEYF